METNNKRNEESRQKIVNKIVDTLQRLMPQTGADAMNELKKIALRFEEKIYTVAMSQITTSSWVTVEINNFYVPVFGSEWTLFRDTCHRRVQME